jgi:tetratricopeptide (TPR) repeat protein
VPEQLASLGVVHLLRGNFMIQGDSVRITVGHLDETGTHRGGPVFTTSLDGWFSDQTRIAAGVASNFLAEIGLDTVVAERPIQGPGQKDYLLGNEWLGRRTPEGVRRAIGHFWDAVEADPDYAPAYAALAQAYTLGISYRYDVGLPAYEAAGLALTAARRAIDLEPTLAGGWSARGFLRVLAGGAAEEAAADFEQARTIQPNNPNVPSWSARVLTLQGDPEGALDATLRAAELDPMHSGRQIAVAYQGLHQGDFTTSLEHATDALSIEPELMLARALVARASLLMGDVEGCLNLDLGPYRGTRAACLWTAGEREAAELLAARIEETFAAELPDGFTPVLEAEDLALFYAWTGRVDPALRWVREAFERSPTGIERRVLESDLFDPVSDDPRFREAIASIREGLWARVEAGGDVALTRPEGS